MRVMQQGLNYGKLIKLKLTRHIKFSSLVQLLPIKTYLLLSRMFSKRQRRQTDCEPRHEQQNYSALEAMSNANDK